MAFPNSPSDGQQTTVSNVTYQYNSAKTAWYRIGTIANPITSTVDYYTGNGVQTTFSLSAVPATEDYTFVAVGGVLQPRNTYSLAGSSLVFSGPPPNLSPVEITTFGGSGGSAFGNNSVSIYLQHYTGNITAGNVSSGGYFWSNGSPFVSSDYSNTNVAAYLTVSSVISAINANVTGANAAIVTANSAVVSYVDTLNSAMASNVAGANAAIVTANTSMKSYVDAQDTAITNAWTANAASQQAAILLRANIASPTFTGTVTTPTLSVTGNTTTGNILSSGYFWANGTQFSSGSAGITAGKAYGLSVLFGPGL